MSWSPEISRDSSEFVCVIQLVNCYAAVHVKGKMKTFISEHPETDIKIAQVAATLFAKNNNIHYDEKLKDLNQPILTVVKNGQDWFPAEMHADKLRILTAYHSTYLGRTKEHAIDITHIIAMARGLDFIPSIGISLDK